jgi:cobalamin biosynthesis protein CobD/CbiB
MPERRTPQWYRFGGAIWALVALFYWIAAVVQPKALHLTLAVLFTGVAVVYFIGAKEFARRATARLASRWQLPDK